jgi:hypothetical protein
MLDGLIVVALAGEHGRVPVQRVEDRRAILGSDELLVGLRGVGERRSASSTARSKRASRSCGRIASGTVR